VSFENLPKRLTNPKYTGLLSFIGKSETPLSSYQIFKQTGRSKYVYERIRELTGNPKKPFTFADMMDNPKYRKRIRESNPEYQKELEQKMKAGARGQIYLSITGDHFNRRKQKYSLNFRGFLLYLAGEARAKKQNNRRLREVISNPVILELAPFLQYWQNFEKSKFDVIGTLREIGMEFQNLLTIYPIDYLQQRVTERYFFTVNTYFIELKLPLSFHIYVKNVDKRTQLKLKEYRLRMYSTLNEWYKNEIERNEKNIEFYSEEE
jgi:hypothetical protein